MDFGHHPHPAIDFCIEVEELQAIALDRQLGFRNPDDGMLERRLERAMMFNVGGDTHCVEAKATLRDLIP